jgi:hypothetical protein
MYCLFGKIKNTIQCMQDKIKKTAIKKVIPKKVELSIKLKLNLRRRYDENQDAISAKREFWQSNCGEMNQVIHLDTLL